MTRSRLTAIFMQLPVLIMLLSLLVFGLGISLQYLLNRTLTMTAVGSDTSPFVPVALGGLCTAVLTLVVWFVGVGLLVARRTRLHGADYGQAYQLMDMFRFNDAIPLLERSLALGKETVEVLTLLASAYAYSGQYSRAHGLIDRAVELYPESAVPYRTLGQLFLLEGSDDQAIAAFQTAVEREPAALNWADLGLALLAAGPQHEALPALEKACEEPLPTALALRVYYHLMDLYSNAGNAPKAASAAAKMVSARDGLSTWQDELGAVKGTGYGQRLTREIQAITKALKDADAAQITR
jgi:tetratricopeptide (TPR) repeat protein